MTQLSVIPGSGQMFDAIAPRYDLLNRIISLGIDQRWRKKTVAALALGEGPVEVLDLATGTADLALAARRAHPAARVTGLDPSPVMLEIAARKCAGKAIELVPGDAQALPFADDSFDGITMGFGIRNVPDRALALREMARVLRPGARVGILELSEPRGGLIAPLARLHVHHIVPWIGGLLSGRREYRYLQRSVAAFPPADEFAALMAANGLEVLEARPLTFGVCHLYVGRKP